MEKDIKKTQDVDTPDTSKKEDKQEEISFTEEQQSKINELMALRIERANKGWEEKLEKVQKETEAKILKEKEEAEELAKLSADEREKKVLEQQRKANEDREKLLSERENKLDAITMFSEAGVPIGLVDYVVVADKEITIENAKEFIENYKASLEQSIKKQLEGIPPKDIKDDNITKSSGLKSAY